MRILLVTETLWTGGAETFVLRLARQLMTMDVTAEVLSLNADLNKRELLERFPEVKVHTVSLPLLRWIKRFDRLLRRLRIDFSVQEFLTEALLAKRYVPHYDVFHTHLFPVDHLFAKLKSRLPSLRVVSTLHGDYDWFDKLWRENSPGAPLNWPSKSAFALRCLDKWILIARRQAELLDKFGVPDGKRAWIYNGYETVGPPSEQIDKGAGVRFITVGRGIVEKGWEPMLEAFLRLSPGHEFWLVGEGDHLRQLRESGRYDHPGIRFWGFHPEPIHLIRQSDVFVFASYYSESLPTVVIEALCAGIPAIATAIGEVPEMLRDPDTREIAGELIAELDPRSMVEVLYEKMLSYVSSPELRHRHSGVAKGAFAKFEMRKCAENYLRVYESLEA